MTGTVYAVTGGPNHWYVEMVSSGAIVSGPWTSHALAHSELARLVLPLPAEGIVFLAEHQDPEETHTKILAVGVSLLAAQEALDAYMVGSEHFAQAGPWEAGFGQPRYWQRPVLWSMPGKLINSRQFVSRISIRKEGQ